MLLIWWKINVKRRTCGKWSAIRKEIKEKIEKKNVKNDEREEMMKGKMKWWKNEKYEKNKKGWHDEMKNEEIMKWKKIKEMKNDEKYDEK